MEDNQTSQDIEINLADLFWALWSKKWMIMFCGILLAIITGLVCQFVITKKYESTTKVYVVNRQDSNALTFSDLQMGSQLTKDYKELILSRFVLERVISELNLDQNYGELKNQVGVTIVTDTRLLEITVTDSDPYMAQDIATAVRIAATDHISTVMNIEAVNVADDANLPMGHSSPNVIKNTVIGGMAGIFLAAMIILVLYILDDTIKTGEDVEKHLGLTVLGSIPDSAVLKSTKSTKRKQKDK